MAAFIAIKHCFNPRTRVGCDPKNLYLTFISVRFQSTHPRGVRPFAEKLYRRWYAGFNPRTRVGCDVRLMPQRPRPTLFQSTHPRGVRRSWTARASRSRMFQSTHPRGVRRDEDHQGVLVFPFQSTHPRGVRLLHGDRGALGGLFQSTHPRGVRHAMDKCGIDAENVSIHAPAWGATPYPDMRAPWHRTSFNPRTRVGCDTAPSRTRRD